MPRLLLLSSSILFAGFAVAPAPVASAAAQTAEASAVQTADAALVEFFEAYDEAELAFGPLAKSFRGIRDEDYGEWGDFSDADAVAEQERLIAARDQMRARFADADLSADSRLSYQLFERMAERRSAAFQFRGNDYVFDQMNGAQSGLPAFLINIHRVSNAEEAEAYVSRLQGLGPVMDQLIGEAEAREASGVLPPDWVFPYIISDARNVITGAPFTEGEDAPLFADLQSKVNALDIPDADKADLIARGRAALIVSVGPAYERLIAMFERQQASAPEADGIWRFDNGADYYAERLRYYTTTDLTADEIHQIGLEQVARIHGEMHAIMDQVGFEGTLQEFFVHLRNDDAMFHTTREDYLAEANAVIAAMQERLPEFFGTLPRADVVVQPVEAFREQSAGKAFYNAPTPDGSRPGTYYVNLYNLRDMSRTELEALAYHEAVPGHHLQRALQVEGGDIPPFRRFGGFTAYTEGWGLYSEELGKDMGGYTDPYSDFGRLGMELWRACRLVVDTGIHHMRWSREEAIAYLQGNTPNPEGDIRKAIERYIVYPGQATAYMIGKLKIMELRQRAMDTLGDDFDWRGFHDAVLAPGPVPLDILEVQVDAWIETVRSGD
ncbi:DUF885 domain-containing protein [Parasphingopyxis algicola]|uniref:DUF885 domain-containing protein n=1 Tax=Parasphingopyxis algicola TaxID=2026624 RepID=UPI0015A44925|nr:DUF885 domain-containing protein [Parasphingopyxis algicola]QLC25560.1 DUF885 domain-containing protein [Parasphingopyxis algicola]